MFESIRELFIKFRFRVARLTCLRRQNPPCNDHYRLFQHPPGAVTAVSAELSSTGSLEFELTDFQQLRATQGAENFVKSINLLKFKVYYLKYIKFRAMVSRRAQTSSPTNCSEYLATLGFMD